MTYSLPNDCCSGLANMDFSKVQVPDVNINWSDTNLWVAVSMILFNPLYWNVLARWEYYTQTLSKIARSREVACSLLAASIFGLGVYRDFKFKNAMDSQPQWFFLQQNWALWIGYICLYWGTILVVSSFLALGFYGTFLGDYFGMLMEKRVTSFPFNIIENPMYWGSTCNFLGCALIKGSQAGLFLTLVIALVYKIALWFEGQYSEHRLIRDNIFHTDGIYYIRPFTTKIYDEKRKGKRNSLNKQA